CVGVSTQPGEGAQAQQTVGGQPAGFFVTGTRHDDEHGGKCRPQGHVAGKVCVTDHHAAADQGDKTDPPGDVAEGTGQAQVGDDQCQYTAEGEFPQAGAGVEVGPHGIVRGDPQRVGERTG